MQAARGASLTHSDQGRSRTRRPWRLFLLTAVAAYLVDLVTKSLALAHLADRPPVHVVGSLLRLTLVRNAGAAFSTATGYTVVLSLVALGAIVVVLTLARRLADPVWALALGLLLGGVLGNLTDRVFRDPGFLRGHVVDFIELPHWPVFNVADMCINVAAAIIVVQAIRGVSLGGRRTGARRSGEHPAGEDS